MHRDLHYHHQQAVAAVNYQEVPVVVVQETMVIPEEAVVLPV